MKKSKLPSTKALMVDLSPLVNDVDVTKVEERVHRGLLLVKRDGSRELVRGPW